MLFDSCFLDRWFNPTVHAQAQDRCHRIGQEKEVGVTFFDDAMTVDQVMAFLNSMKSTNATILLADGSEMGASATTGLSYKDLSGMIANMIRAVRSARHSFSKEHYNMQLPPLEESILVEAMEQKRKRAKPVTTEPKASPCINCYRRGLFRNLEHAVRRSVQDDWEIGFAYGPFPVR